MKKNDKRITNEVRGTKEFKAEEILKYLEDNGKVVLSDIQDAIEMKERQEFLDKHPYKVTLGKDGYWRTYFPDDTQKGGRKLVKKKDKKNIENAIVSFYRLKVENPTIKQVFTEWNDRRFKLNKIAASTHERDGQVFRRHYKEMGKRRIRDVGSDEFADFLEEQIAECNLIAKAFSNLKSVTRGMLKRAKKRKLIDWSPEEMIQDLDTSGSSFRKVIKEPDEVVFNEDELPVYVAYLEEDLDLKNLGILLMFFTGVRVGELVTLKFSDIEDNTIKIRRTETRVRVKAGKYKYLVKEFPKSSAGVRTVILPETYSWIIPRLKACSPSEEYVFTAEDGTRMTTNVIRRRMEKTCKAAKLKPKSPHKARKTYGSILLDNNIDNRMVTELMGHTDIGCTEGYYHKNRRSIQRKSEILNKIPEFKAI